MIIKSMSRKSMSFSQLLDYLHKEETLERFSHNLYADINNNPKLSHEFMENAKYIQNSRGKVYLYHEVISLESSHLNKQQIQKILSDLSREYLSLRADKHLAFGAIHLDSNNPHIHLMISANEIEGNKRIRLSKEEFATIQMKLEAYKNRHYDRELGITGRYTPQKDRSKSKQKEQEMKHKRNKKTIKDRVKEDLQTIFEKSLSKQALEKALKAKGYELYTRGNTTGVIHEGKKYRLKTLELERAYNKAIQKAKKRDLRQEKRHEFKQEQSYSR